MRVARTKIGVDINDHDDTACANNDIIEVDNVTASDKNDDSNFFSSETGSRASCRHSTFTFHGGRTGARLTSPSYEHWCTNVTNIQNSIITRGRE